jgi:hypothetical protein
MHITAHPIGGNIQLMAEMASLGQKCSRDIHSDNRCSTLCQRQCLSAGSATNVSNSCAPRQLELLPQTIHFNPELIRDWRQSPTLRVASLKVMKMPIPHSS